MTETQAINKIGGPIIKTLATAWKSAWSDILGPLNHPDFDNRTRSVLLQQMAVIHARPPLIKLGVKYICDETQHLFIIPDKAVVILKKLDEDRRPRKNNTMRANAQFQSLMFEELPTLVAGMAVSANWTSVIGIYLYRPQSNNLGNSWTLEISDGITPIDANQSKFTDLFDNEFEDNASKQPKQKFKPKHETGDSSEEAGSGGGSI